MKTTFILINEHTYRYLIEVLHFTMSDIFWCLYEMTKEFPLSPPAPPTHPFLSPPTPQQKSWVGHQHHLDVKMHFGVILRMLIFALIPK